MEYDELYNAVLTSLDSVPSSMKRFYKGIFIRGVNQAFVNGLISKEDSDKIIAVIKETP